MRRNEQDGDYGLLRQESQELFRFARCLSSIALDCVGCFVDTQALCQLSASVLIQPLKTLAQAASLCSAPTRRGL